MKLHHRRLVFPLVVLTATLMFFPAACRAQLLPAGDFMGKSLNEWGLDWIQWGIATGLGGQTLPDTVDGVRYLPPNFGSSFVADLTIQQGTPLVFSTFLVFGEKYDDGSEDDPVASEPIIDMIFGDTTISTTFDGSVVLEGLASDFPERLLDITLFPEPIPYAEPQPRGPGLNSIAAFWGTGITAIFDNLPLGEHTIMNVYNSPFFGGTFSSTYNITIVPEPVSLIPVGICALGFIGYGRQRRSQKVPGNFPVREP